MISGCHLILSALASFKQISIRLRIQVQPTRATNEMITTSRSQAALVFINLEFKFMFMFVLMLRVGCCCVFILGLVSDTFAVNHMMYDIQTLIRGCIQLT